MEKTEFSKQMEFAHSSVFLVDEKNKENLGSIEALIKNGFIECPVPKRTLFIIPDAFMGDGLRKNLSFLNPEQPVIEDLKTLNNPALSIVSHPGRIIDHLRRDNISLSIFGKIIIFCFVEPSQGEQTFINDVSFLLSKVTNLSTEIVYFTYCDELPIFFPPNTTKIKWKDQTREKIMAKNEEDVKITMTEPKKITKAKLERSSFSKEKKHMDNKNRKRELDLNKERVKDLLSQTLNYSNPEDLEKAKLLIKKNVPFFRRSYFTAYMLCLLSAKRGNGGHASKYNSNPNSISFYINLGSQDKLTPKSLSDFIVENTKIQKEDILGINFKNAYSFFTVDKSKSTNIIESINEKVIGNKKVKVNFANRK